MSGELKNVGDYAAGTGGAMGALTHYADLSNVLASYLSALVLFLSAVWFVWRMVDRVRFGPGRSRDE